MQNINKTGKISIIILVLIICLAASYFLFFNKSDKVNEIKKDPAIDLLNENSEALKKAESGVDGTVRKADASDHILGDLVAPVEIIVYDDFDNEFSAEYFKTLKQAVSNFGDKVVIAYRHFPMRSHQNSYFAAISAECAGQQDAFWEMTEQLFAAKLENRLDEENVGLIAAELKLDMEKFNTCLTDTEISDKIQKSITEADSINVTGVPATFINSIPYPGAMPYEDFTDSSGLFRKGLGTLIEELVK